MFQSSLPMKFWSFAILTATHIINLLPISILNWKTPFELLYCKQPDYTRLKTFGCLANATKLTPPKDKFGARAHKYIFLGYVPGTKGYRLFDIEAQQILTSRDVIFYETTFPFHQANLVDHTLPLSFIPSSDSDFDSIDISQPSTTAPSSPLNNSSPPPAFVLRRSTRHTTKPPWLIDFATYTVHAKQSADHHSTSS